MAKTIVRKTLNLWGGSGASSSFAQFGSQTAGAPVKTKDVDTIQALAAWADGWQDAVALGQAPYLEDMNAVMYVHAYQQFYALQEGVAEWDTGTTYFVGSIVKRTGTCELYMSLIDANAANALPTAGTSNTNWQFIMGIIGGNFRVGGTLATFTQNIAFSPTTKGITGTTTNDDAPAGTVGEAVRSAVAAANLNSSSVYQDLTTIALTAGDWDVTGQVTFAANGATLTGNNQIYVSLYSGATNTDFSDGDNAQRVLSPTTGGSPQDCSATIAAWRVSIATSKTAYLKASMSFSGGTPQAFGRISARRVR